MVSSNLPLTSLSDDVLLYLFRFTDPIDVLKLRTLSSRLSVLSKDESLWRELMQTIQRNLTPAPTLHLQNMKRMDLEKCACLPRLFLSTLESSKEPGSPLQPQFVILEPHEYFHRSKNIKVIPGGQFLLVWSPDSLQVWKLPTCLQQGEHHPRLVARCDFGRYQANPPFSPQIQHFTLRDGLQLNLLLSSKHRQPPYTIATLFVPFDDTLEGDNPFTLQLDVIATPPSSDSAFSYSDRLFGRPVFPTLASRTNSSVDYFVCDAIRHCSFTVSLLNIREVDYVWGRICGTWLVVEHAKSKPSKKNTFLTVFDLSAIVTENQQLWPVFEMDLAPLCEHFKEYGLTGARVYADSFVGVLGSTFYEHSIAGHTFKIPSPLIFFLEVKDDGSLELVRDQPVTYRPMQAINNQAALVDTSGSAPRFYFSGNGARDEDRWATLCFGSSDIDWYENSRSIYSDAPGWINAVSACPFSGRTVRLIHEPSDGTQRVVLQVHDMVKLSSGHETA